MQAHRLKPPPTPISEPSYGARNAAADTLSSLTGCLWPHDPDCCTVGRTGLLYAASLWFSNASYLYLSVSFIQMMKSLMPGLVYASGVVMGTEKFSRA